MRNQITALAVAFLATLPVAPAKAAPITFTFEGITTGYFETRPEYTTFNSAEFRIVATADTANIQSVQFASGVTLLSLDTDTATMSIDGVGLFEFTLGTRVYIRRRNDPLSSEPPYVLGFGREGINGDPVFQFANPEWATYDLATEFDPWSVTLSLQACCGALPTTFGGLSGLNFSVADVTFAANIPEPSTYALLLFALAANAAVTRRRTRVGSGESGKAHRSDVHAALFKNESTAVPH